MTLPGFDSWLRQPYERPDRIEDEETEDEEYEQERKDDNTRLPTKFS